MENIIIGILITLLAIAIIAEYKIHQDKKSKENNIAPNIEKNNIEEDEEKVSELDKYNAIIDLSNQIQITNILLFLILVVLFIKLLLPSILAALGIGYVMNELNNMF